MRPTVGLLEGGVFSGAIIIIISLYSECLQGSPEERSQFPECRGLVICFHEVFMKLQLLQIDAFSYYSATNYINGSTIRNFETASVSQGSFQPT